MTKLNDFRIRRMFAQLYKKRMYMLLCFVLLFLSAICFDLKPYLVKRNNDSLTARPSEAALKAETDLNLVSYTGGREKQNTKDKKTYASANFFANLLLNGEKSFLWCTQKVASNPLIFIFFAGFTGGIFSNMMRFQPSNQLPGDELYVFWYRITKPVIGAFGAMVLFIILISPAFRGGVEVVFAKGVVDNLIASPTSATGFAFGFLMGFSERVILPKLN
jgi:hypothetical protein